jgi:adenylylsulfate kinase
MAWALWITGVPGSGKTTLAQALARRLNQAGVAVERLELDEMRRLVTPAPTYTEAERDLVYRAFVYTAARLVRAGHNVIMDATAHRRRWRDLAREVIPRFAEVELRCPVETCAARERVRDPGYAPSGVYAAATAPSATVPGINLPYEHSEACELVLDTVTLSPGDALERLVAFVRTSLGP